MELSEVIKYIEEEKKNLSDDISAEAILNNILAHLMSVEAKESVERFDEAINKTKEESDLKYLKQVLQKCDVKYVCDRTNQIFSFDIHWDISENRYLNPSVKLENGERSQANRDFNVLYKAIFELVE